jgi:putative peptide zinc metalloprotease protein
MLTDLTLLRPFDATRWVIAAPGGRHLLVNAAAADLYRLLAQADSFEAARMAFNARFAQDLAPDAFMAFVEAQFGGYELLHGDTVAVRPLLPVPVLRLRVEFIPARVAARLTAWLRPFYAPRVFWGSSALLAVALVAGHALARPAQLPTGSEFWVTLPLVYASMVFHEFGHVAATSRAGVKHGGIGVGLYAYLFPVLYADVTGIWLANKQERIIANLAGIHSQLLYAAVMAGGYLLSGYAPLRFVAGTVSIAALWQFNPFVRHDGYWLLSDLANTPNLLPKANAVVRESLSGAGVRQLVASRGRSLLPGPRTALFTYGVLNTSLLVFFIGYTIWHHVGLVVTFPSVILSLLGKLLHGTLQGADVNQAQFVVLALYLVLARYVLYLARKWWQRPAPLVGGL